MSASSVSLLFTVLIATADAVIPVRRVGNLPYRSVGILFIPTGFGASLTFDATSDHIRCTVALIKGEIHIEKVYEITPTPTKKTASLKWANLVVKINHPNLRATFATRTKLRHKPVCRVVLVLPSAKFTRMDFTHPLPVPRVGNDSSSLRNCKCCISICMWKQSAGSH